MPTPTNDNTPTTTQVIKSAEATLRPLTDPTAHASHAATSRWQSVKATAYDWEHSPVTEALDHLAYLRKEIELGSRTLQQRISTATATHVECNVCGKLIPNGKWAQARTIRDPNTALLTQIFFCSPYCINGYQQRPSDHKPAYGPTGLPTPEPPMSPEEYKRQLKQQQ